MRSNPTCTHLLQPFAVHQVAVFVLEIAQEPAEAALDLALDRLVLHPESHAAVRAVNFDLIFLLARGGEGCVRVRVGFLKGVWVLEGFLWFEVGV